MSGKEEAERFLDLPDQSGVRGSRILVRQLRVHTTR
jgi:hypothetical protein